MNNETLKRDLCARLMDGVKIDTSYYEETEPLTMSYLDDDESVYVRINIKAGQYKHELLQSYDLEHIKPYLFPTSALTNPIQIASYNNGEPFVPVVEITTEANKREESSEYYSFIYEVRDNWIHLSRGSYDDYERIPIWDIENKCSNAPNWIIERLNQWHINYRLSPEQFIEVTDEFNPYK